MRNWRRSRPAILAAAALTLALGACGSFRQPTIELEGLSLGSVGLTGGTVMVNVRVDNPNGFTLGAEGIDYVLRLRNGAGTGDSAWVQVAQGRYDERIEVRGNSTEVVRIPVEFSFSELGGAAGSILRRGRVDYLVSGTAHVRQPLRRSVPFRKAGAVMVGGD